MASRCLPNMSNVGWPTPAVRTVNGREVQGLAQKGGARLPSIPMAIPQASRSEDHMSTEQNKTLIRRFYEEVYREIQAPTSELLAYDLQ
jgi:hypothetical protein